jgi:hypothetical protein
MKQETMVFRDRLLGIFIYLYLIIFWKFLPKKREKFALFEVEYALVPKIIFSFPRALQRLLVKEGKGLMGVSIIFRGKPLICIPADIPVQYRRFFIFHEWIERKYLLDWSKGIDLPDEKEIMKYTERFGKPVPQMMAHDYAFVGEALLAKGELSKEEFSNFLQWKKDKETK